MTEGPLQVERRSDERGEVFVVEGEIDLGSTEQLEAAVAQSEARTVVLDLSGVSFMDSAGLRSLELAHRGLLEADRRLLVVAPPDSRADWTFRLAGVGEGFAVESVEAAWARASLVNDT